MNENNSNATDSTIEDTGRGHWETDPDDPEFEVWVVDPPRTTPEVAVEKPERSLFDPEPPDLSNRVVEWGDGRTPNPNKICTARKTNGEPCRKQRVVGAVVCATHGGRAPQVKAKARIRLEMAADKLARELLGLATDTELPPAVRLAAVRDALSRIGISEKTAVEVQVGPNKPFQDILEAVMTGGSRAESRSRRGEPDDHAAPDADWLDGEIVDAQAVDFENHTPPQLTPRHHDEPSPVAGEGTSTETGMLDLADALDQLRGTTPPPPRKGSR